MTSPLHGAELIDCARANGKQGIEVAADLCGYGNNLAKFEQALTTACEEMGIEFNAFTDLLKTPDDRRALGLEIAPDTPSQL
ncbi:MAG: hypothetical protein HC881_19090 [Leptolyngbyaceae cyanobacterium SL_7_1]|nr:hypothetical protein [Leptolyngbyaceae cyanobacterium SL_7_1]